MAVRGRGGRLLGVVLACAVAGGLLVSAVAAGALRWDTGWLADRPRPRPGSWVPPTTEPAPPETYPVVPAQPGVPPARYLQPVYALPHDARPVRGQPEAILHSIGEVTGFFRAELDGAYPRFAPDGQAPGVITVVLPWSRREMAESDQRLEDLAPWLHDQGRIEPHAIPVLYVEASAKREEACAWAWVAPAEYKRLADPRLGPESARFRADIERRERIVIPLHRCPETRPSRESRWPHDGTHLLAHEATHALGAVDAKAPHYSELGHTGEDPRDILYRGPERRLLDRYAVDPGHDDYYRHGRADLPDIADSELLVRPPG